MAQLEQLPKDTVFFTQITMEVAEDPEFFIEGTEDDVAREPQNWGRFETARGPRVLAFGRDPYFPGWPDAVQLKRMYLRPEDRGQGLGRRLLDMALLWAREHRIRTISLDTAEQMEAAQRLYERYGFVHVDGDAPRQGQSRLLYELRL